MKDVPDIGTEMKIAPQGVAPEGHSVPTIVPRVVIVGAGFGGLQAAQALRNTPVQVTVVDRSNHHLFQPLLYQVATAVLSPAEICAPIRAILRKQKNVEVLMGEVTGVDVQKQQVFMGDQSLPFDYLILATGAQDSYFGHSEWASYAPGLKSIGQATEIRSQVLRMFEQAEREQDEEKRRALLTFVLVGAGPTGVEMAGAIADLAHKTLVPDFRHINPREARIILVEALPRILAAFPEALASKARKALNHLGVEVRTNAPVEGNRQGRGCDRWRAPGSQDSDLGGGCSSIACGRLVGSRNRQGRPRQGRQRCERPRPPQYIRYWRHGAFRS